MGFLALPSLDVLDYDKESLLNLIIENVTTQQLRLPTAIAKETWIWNGHKVQYAVQGVGRPLLLIHGFGASIGHWRKNIPALAEGGYRVFALDLLGFGGSDKAPLNYTLELW